MYWRNPGDSGLPPKLTWTLPPDWKAGDFEWPVPKRLPLATLLDYGYEGDVLLPMTIVPAANTPAGNTDLKADLRVLVCREVCVPGHATLSLSLPVRPTPAIPDPTQALLFQAARKTMPQPQGSTVKVSGIQDASAITLTVTGVPRSAQLSFMPAQRDRIENAAPQQSEGTADGVRLSLKPAGAPPPENVPLEGILLVKDGAGTMAYDITAPVTVTAAARTEPVSSEATNGTPNAVTSLPQPNVQTAAPGPATSGTLLTLLAFAFGGGLILNLMPCVFPVLSIKVLSLLAHSGGEKKVIRTNAYLYTAGVLFSFWLLVGLLLGLRVAGRNLGWGFQLQSPGFVAFLVCLLFTLGLSLLGAFEIGASFMNFGSSLAGTGNTYSSSFFTGILATVVATPCTAPLMGVAVGYALAQPAIICFLVFTAMALGLASPFLLLSVFPQASAVLPRPGRWMEVLKQVMAFPIFGTVIWLLWVLGLQIGVTQLALILFALLTLGLAAWIAGRWPRSNTATVIALLLGIGITAYACTGISPLPAGAGSTTTGQTASGGLQWESFTPEKLASYRASGHPVLVDFTAAWCLTCQVNDRILFHSNTVEQRLNKSKIALLRADWTSYDPQITAVLAGYGRSSIPLYVIYGATPGAQPVMLPDGVLSPSTLLTTLDNLKL